MAIPKAKPVLNPAEALIGRFMEHHGIAPTARRDLIGRFKDLLGVVDAEVGWDLMQKTLDDDSDEGLSHLRAPDRIVVPYELAEAAFGASPTMTARGVLREAVGQDVYDLTFKAWGATVSNLPRGKLRPGKAPTTDDDEKVQMAPPPKKETGDSKAGPFSENFKGTDEARALEIAGLIRSLGTAPVSKMAAASKRDLAGRPLRKSA